MKTTVTLLIACLLCFGCAGMTATETGAVISAVGASVVGIVDAITPLLPPEAVAKLHATASQIDGGIEATKLALGAVADVITQFKANTGAQLTAHAEKLAGAMQSMAELPTRTEMLLQDGGVATGAVGGSRLLSHFKHSRGAKA